MKRFLLLPAVILYFIICPILQITAQANTPLPSWNDGKCKQSIIEFISRVTDKESPDFVPPPERIAVFDNDGTLWSEQPLYFQFAYAVDTIRKMAPQHPEWQKQEPFASILKGDFDKALAGGEKSLMEIMAVSHAGMTTDQFESAGKAWFAEARHPKTGRLYSEMIFQPMLELLDYLRANQFKTFIVSGGGIDFIRLFAEEAYGIPPEQVIGSSLKEHYEIRDGVPVITKIAEPNFYDDKEGKPVGIHQYIGRRPIFAGGNSDGDFQMLEWTTTGNAPGFGLIIHHTDAEREWAYDRESHIGTLKRGLDEAAERGWTLVDMKKDWKVIYPPAK